MQTITIDLPDHVKNDIAAIKQTLLNLKDNFQPKEPSVYLTRHEVASMLSIDISSVHNWTKKGILKAYQIGGRVYYNRAEVENALVELKK